jgi:hypothetical protein
VEYRQHTPLRKGVSGATGIRASIASGPALSHGEVVRVREIIKEKKNERTTKEKMPNAVQYAAVQRDDDLVYWAMYDTVQDALERTATARRCIARSSNQSGDISAP